MDPIREHCLSAPRRATAAIAVLLLALAGARGGEAAIIRVGAVGDVACDQNDIDLAILQAALNGQDDEIRIARNQTYTNEYLHLTSFPDVLLLRGGFDNCADTTANGRTTLNGRNNQPVVEVDGGTASDVRLQGLTLVTPAAGTTEVVRVEEAGRLLADDSDFTGGAAGGLTISGVDAEVSLSFTTSVHGNDGLSGGGIVCGTGGTLVTAGLVTGNTASFNGGGIFAVESCSITLANGAWVHGNDAGFDGGGIYLASGADLIAAGGAGVGLRIFDNTAGDQGGGIFAHMPGTTALLNNAHVDENLAEVTGGGLFAFDGATITMDRVAPTSGCVDPVRCSTLSLNELVSGTNGSAAAAAGGGDVFLNQTFVEGNVIPEAELFGSVLHASGTGSQIKTESVQLFGNTGADAVFESQLSAFVWATFTTAARNRWDNGGTPTEARGFFLANGGTGRINSSVFWPTAGQFVGGGGSAFTQVDCLVTSTTTGLPAGATFVSVVDPLYENLGTGDLAPRPGSPAVDFCDTFRYAPLHNDLRHATRGHDHATNPNGFPGVTGGVQDVGAYEQHELFADGFESGDTTRWSSTSP